jgi:hypothetical protein
MWSEELQSSIMVCPINLAMCILTFQFKPLLYGRYCLRWGRPPSSDRRGKLRGCTWKKLYFERDEADMVEFVRNTPVEFREYYVQMQAAKRSQAPLPSQVSSAVASLN